MNPRLTKDLKLKFLGISPVFKDKTGLLNPQEIVALSALLTFKGRSIKNLLKEINQKGENLDDKIKKILQRSSLRGHASIATTPSLCLTYEGSKFLDSALTGIVFSSSLVSSGRRTRTEKRDIIFPIEIFKAKEAKKIYQEVSEKIINFFNFLLNQKIQKDEASKILQYGIYGTGIIQLPVESIVLIKREYTSEKEWMPEEIGIFLQKLEENLKSLGIDLLFPTREVAPRNIYPYPNIFKNPKETNLVRDLLKKVKLKDGSKIISLEYLPSKGLKRELESFEQKKKRVFSSLIKIRKEWLNLLPELQKILRDYNLALKVKVLSSIPWRVWGEKKRHRTCPQIIESIYFCLERTIKKFNKFKKQIEKKQITKNLVNQIEEVFSIPPSIKKNSTLLSQYLLTALKSFEGYQNLIKLKIKPRDAIFLVPRGVKIDILQEYDLYNLLAGYYPLRLCQTAEEEMRRNTRREVGQIKKALQQKKVGWLAEFINPKCQIVGFCPEEKSCGLIKKAVKNYSEQFHQEMKANLKQRFQEKFKNETKKSRS